MRISVSILAAASVLMASSTSAAQIAKPCCTISESTFLNNRQLVNDVRREGLRLVSEGTCREFRGGYRRVTIARVLNATATVMLTGPSSLIGSSELVEIAQDAADANLRNASQRCRSQGFGWRAPRSN